MLKSRMFMLTVSSAALIPAVAVMPEGAAAAVKNPFKDVPADSPVAEAAQALSNKGILTGYQDGTFRPHETITRKQAAVLLSRAQPNLPDRYHPKAPKDISARDPQFEVFQQMQRAKAFSLDPYGRFNPARPLTRGDVAQALTNGFQLTIKSEQDVLPNYSVIAEMQKQWIRGAHDRNFQADTIITREEVALVVEKEPQHLPRTAYLQEFFQDVNIRTPYFTAAHRLMEAEVLLPDVDYKFNPDQPLSRKEMDKLLAILLGQQAGEEPYGIIRKAQQTNVLTQSKEGLGLDRPVTRGEMSDVLTGVFSLPKEPMTFEGISHYTYYDYFRALYSNGIAVGFEDRTYRIDEPITRGEFALMLYRAMNVKEENLPKIKYSDRQSSMDIPRPRGYVGGEHEEKQLAARSAIMKENQHGYAAAFTIREDIYQDGNSLERRIRRDAAEYGLTYAEYVDIINWTIDTGEVYDGKHFTVFFEFPKGMVNTSGVRKNSWF